MSMLGSDVIWDIAVIRRVLSCASACVRIARSSAFRIVSSSCLLSFEGAVGTRSSAERSITVRASGCVLRSVTDGPEPV